MVEQNARGGESILLHLDDWKELDKYANHPLGNHKFPSSSPRQNWSKQKLANDSMPIIN